MTQTNASAIVQRIWNYCNISPTHAFPKLPDRLHRRIFRENALEFYGQAAAGGPVHADAIPARTAQEFVDGQPDGLARQIPEGDVNAAERAHLDRTRPHNPARCCTSSARVPPRVWGLGR